MKHSYLGKGDAPKLAADPQSIGLNAQKRLEGGTQAMLRGETSIMKQQPKPYKNTVSSDRGTFRFEH